MIELDMCSYAGCRRRKGHNGFHWKPAYRHHMPDDARDLQNVLDRRKHELQSIINKVCEGTLPSECEACKARRELDQLIRKYGGPNV